LPWIAGRKGPTISPDSNQSGAMMRWRWLNLIAALAFSGGVVYSQSIPKFEADEFEATMGTKLPIDKEGSEWECFAGSKDGPDYFVYSKGLDKKMKTVATWIRQYDYKKREMLLQHIFIKRNTKEKKLAEYILYNLDTGDVIYSGNMDPSQRNRFSLIPPGTILDGLLVYWDGYEAYEKNALERRSKTKGKK
jgi:hypothetical protein